MAGEEGVDDSFEEGPNSVDESHEGEGAFDAVDIIEEVLGEPAVAVVDEEEAGEGEEEDEEEAQNEGGQVEFVGEAETAHGEEVAESQKSEELDVALHAHEAEEAPEREHSQVLTEFVLEEAVEDPVQHHEQQHCEGYCHQEVLKSTAEEEAVLALHLCILVLRHLRKVVWEGGQHLLCHKGQSFWIYELLLLGFDHPHRPEDVAGEPRVLDLVVLVEPEVVSCEQQELQTPEPQHRDYCVD